MSEDHDIELSSSPCFLGEPEFARELAPSSPASAPLMKRLGQALGITVEDGDDSPEKRLLSTLTHSFRAHDLAPGSELAAPGRPWSDIYFVQYGILELSRQSPEKKATILEFFPESALVWPVYKDSRTTDNTLSLVAVAGGQVWVADFGAFHLALEKQGVWEQFARPLTDKLTDQALSCESRRQQLTASDRYRRLLADYPSLARRLPSQKLADWLGVDYATFSRIRAETADRH